ncbi:hypothetical protein Xph01_30550 [Micromonospora phaseoli]|nr:hypothetical protein Xph01_30550 [Micromonospora phaseoli]
MAVTLPKAGDCRTSDPSRKPPVHQPIMFRAIRVLDWVTYDHWVWLDGYQLDRKGDAVARRSVYVQKEGIRVSPVNRN